MATNYSAYEIRWFGERQLPSDVEATLAKYFDDNANVNVDKRSDIYFSAIDNEALGIKLRDSKPNEKEGKLEIKLRTFRDPQLWQAGTTLGWAEDWTRVGWTFPGTDQRAFADICERSFGLRRVEIAKNRLQWKFIPKEGAVPTPIDPKQRAVCACMVEKTLIEITYDEANKAVGMYFWSIAMEAFDEGANRKAEMLRLGLNQVFSGYNGEALSSARSLSYPARAVQFYPMNARDRAKRVLGGG